MSIEYYNENAQAFIDSTFKVDVSYTAYKFLKHIPKDGVILDVGCGSGRDSLIFSDLGYEVYAMDGSVEMVNHAKQFLGDRVQLATFEDYHTDIRFDGIWALASLIHVPEKDMSKIILKYCNFLKTDGLFLMSFKDREVHFSKGSREFTCYTKDTLSDMIESIDGIKIVDLFGTEDVREDHVHERWVTVIVKRRRAYEL